MGTEHNPTPWEIRDYDINGNGNRFNTREYGYVKVYAADGEDVITEIDVSTPDGEANVQLLIRAANSHDDLVAALESLIVIIQGNYDEAVQYGRNEEAGEILPALEMYESLLAAATPGTVEEVCSECGGAIPIDGPKVHTGFEMKPLCLDCVGKPAATPGEQEGTNDV